jgi:hypothetical protein
LAIGIAGIFLQAASPAQNTLMDKIEGAVTLPRGAQSLSHYVRRYAYLGDHAVVGVYVSRDMDKGGLARSWVDAKQLPHISDGGCGIVTVFYDPRKNLPPDAMCNPAV